MQPFALMQVSSDSCEMVTSETVICRCLQVSEGTVQDAIAACGLETIRQVCSETGAGGGCTACHARIRELLREARRASAIGASADAAFCDDARRIVA